MSYTKKPPTKRRRDKSLIFDDHPEFRPNLTPAEIFQMGSFGGTYYRDIYSGVNNKNYKNAWKEFPKEWFKGLNIKTQVASQDYDVNVNKYGVKSGTSLEYWESKGWIKPQDPYGWVHWYCRFYLGRRSRDDERQIKRWDGVCNGRFRLRLDNMIRAKKDSPVIRQLLLHWAYEY